jgi:hypothetical protein
MSLNLIIKTAYFVREKNGVQESMLTDVQQEDIRRLTGEIFAK